MAIVSRAQASKLWKSDIILSMGFLVLIYLIVEAVNIIFTSKFGFSHSMHQPLAYRSVRRILIAIRYLLVTVIFFINFNSNLLLGFAFLITPFFVDKAIFLFCKKRERNSGYYDSDVLKK